MKILALTSFLIVLVSALSLQTESFEVNEVTGGFSKTCRNTKLAGSLLTSECKDRKGKWVSSSVSLDACVANRNGKLTSNGNNFSKSSKGCSLKKNVLSCQSKNMKGKYLKTAMNLDTLVTNNNGILTCGKVAGKRVVAAKGGKKTAAKKSKPASKKIGRRPSGKRVARKPASKKRGKKTVAKRNAKGKPAARAAAGQRDFSKTCNKIRFNAKTNTLTASCKNRKGKRVNASLSLSKCVANNNGKLQRGAAFNKSSRSCSYKGGNLSCQSKTKKGKYNKTSLNLNTIVGNDNGVLKC